MKKTRATFVKAKPLCDISPGEALQITRELQDLSQNKLAELSGISQPNISALENNAVNMGRERAIVLARALNVHPAVLLFSGFQMQETKAA